MMFVFPTPRQIPRCAGFMDAIGNRHYSKADAWGHTISQLATVDDFYAFPRQWCLLNTSRAWRLKYYALHHVAQVNRALRA